MTKEEYEKKLEKIRLKNKERNYKNKLKKEKNKYKTKRKLPSTSKLVLIGSILLCLQIIIFCELLMWKTGDLSSLYVLIGIAASLTSIILGYYIKSKAENTAGGIIFETAMEEMRQLGQLSAEDAVCDDEIEG